MVPRHWPIRGRVGATIPSSSRLGPLNVDLEDRQAMVAAERSARDSDLRLGVSDPNGSGLEGWFAAPDLLGRPAAQRLVNANLVEPVPVGVQAPLEPPRCPDLVSEMSDDEASC